jgi:hypothetical protein
MKKKNKLILRPLKMGLNQLKIDFKRIKKYFNKANYL